MYEFSNFMKAANEMAEHPALESVLIQPVDAIGTNYLIGENVAMEGIFFDDKKVPQWVENDSKDGLVKSIGLGGWSIMLPNGNWPKEYFAKHPKGRESLIKNGVKFTAKYVELLASAMQEWTNIRSMVMDAIEKNDIEAYGQAIEKLNGIYNDLVELNKTKDVVSTGMMEELPEKFISSMKPIMEKYCTVFDSAVKEFYQTKAENSTIAKIKNILPKVKAKKTRKIYHPNELVMFCYDLWHIISDSTN